MTSYIFLCFLHLGLIHLTCGETEQRSNTVLAYGLPELTRDILEKIKAATGRPINTNHFFPILAASSKGYEVFEGQPYTKTVKYSRNKGGKKHDGGHYHSKKGKDNSGRGKSHYYDIFDGGLDGEESIRHKYEDETGKKHRYEEGRVFRTNHHKDSGGHKGGKSKKGRRRGKSSVEKGFRDIYHKDEEKKSNFFWNNKHEEGKWVHYGLKNRKTDKSHDKGGEGKHREEGSEGSEYEKKENKCTKCKTR